MKTKVCKFVNDFGNRYYLAHYSYAPKWIPVWLVMDWYTIHDWIDYKKFGTFSDAKQALREVAENYKRTNYKRKSCNIEEM